MIKKSTSTIVICVLAFALLTAISLLIFLSLASGTSVDEARQAHISSSDEASVLRSLLLDMQSMNQKEASALIQRKYSSKHIVKFTEKGVSIDSVLLKYKNENLSQVCSEQVSSINSCVSRSE